jgi:AAA domain, putative AbiEii toxin, Type IV TA system/AAA domain
MKIRRIWLKDVGPFKELDIEIPPGTRPDRADVVVITGPNGSGKTTLLYALATVLGDTDQLIRRWGHSGEVAVSGDLAGIESVLTVGLGYADRNYTEIANEIQAIEDPVKSGWQYPAGSVGVFDPFGDVGRRYPAWYADKDSKYVSERSLAILQNHIGPIFAYEARRRLTPGTQLNIGAGNKTNPFEDSGNFEGSIVPGTFETWVANTRAKLSFAREAGDTQAVARYERIIETVEKAIGELTGSSFSLRVTLEPLEVLGVLNGTATPLDLLPDGLRSSIAWLGDVLRRLDQMERYDGSDPLQAPIIVLLDEIDAHLHPEWQRKILYVAERLLPNAQLIVSTHSPFIVQSATDACIIKLGAHGESAEVVGPQSGSTFDAVLEDILGVRGDSFSVEIEAQLDTFKQQRNEVLQGKLAYEVLEARAKELAALSESLDLSLQRHLVDVKARIGAA